jgi:hypothetical protein
LVYLFSFTWPPSPVAHTRASGRQITVQKHGNYARGSGQGFNPPDPGQADHSTAVWCEKYSMEDILVAFSPEQAHKPKAKSQVLTPPPPPAVMGVGHRGGGKGGSVSAIWIAVSSSCPRPRVAMGFYHGGVGGGGLIPPEWKPPQMTGRRGGGRVDIGSRVV